MEARDLDLNKLRTFFVIAEQGGVSAAARQLSLTRSAISHSLVALEESLGTALFHRVGKKLVLTREGAALRRAYGDVHERLTAALDDVRGEAGEVKGWIRLGLYPGFSRVRLAAVLARFRAANPRARVRVSTASRAELQERLLAGRLDFALSLRPTESAAANRIRSIRLFEQRLVLAVAPAARPRRLDAPAIAAVPVIDYFRSEPLIDRWTAHHFGRRGRSPRGDVVVWAGGETDLAVELTARGVGACVLPQDLVDPYRKRKELAVIRGAKAPLRDDIWLNAIDSTHESPIQTAFREALV